MATKNKPIPPGFRPKAESAANKGSWKESPLVVATAAVSGKLTATIAVFLQVVLPTREAELKNEITELTKAQTRVQAKLDEKDSELKSVQANLVATKARADSLQAELRVALTSQLFNANDPYPNGLRAVRVGERIDAVPKMYPKATIDRSTNGVLVLKDYHPTFSTVSFFFDESDANRQITHIAFEIKKGPDYASEFLQRKLRDALGEPRSGVKPDQFGWVRAGGAGTFKADAYSYLIAKDGVTPQWWRQ
ncbi:hypothetical protein GCM10028796_01160 [Ramlibacter monticola]|uniref:Uncharacterized protein n=1 Tax=Ramlibacter monticola TaxID=1926872 RepID=A0A936YZT0_9BURK|nr:hypothetical protein [Ramlibacter monticola]MBL0391589.1 hypothetical protein [Ramlibacter monticola]